jgi:hypothetical protein
MADSPKLFDDFRLMDFYDPASGDIVIPAGVRLRFVAPGDTIGSRLRAGIPPPSDNEDIER